MQPSYVAHATMCCAKDRDVPIRLHGKSLEQASALRALLICYLGPFIVGAAAACSTSTRSLLQASNSTQSTGQSSSSSGISSSSGNAGSSDSSATTTNYTSGNNDIFTGLEVPNLCDIGQTYWCTSNATMDVSGIQPCLLALTPDGTLRHLIYPMVPAVNCSPECSA